MITKRAGFLLILFWGLPLAAAEVSFTVAPNASIRYRGEGKVQPQSYVNRFGGETSPLYRLEVTQTPRRLGYWGLSLWHTGEFGGGNYAEETVPDAPSGGVYQVNKLNVGFTNFFVTFHRALADWPVEALVNFSVVRQIFKRKQFIVQGVDARPSGLDDVNEISAEGFGFGLAGRHGDRVYFRWQTAANYYIQLFDAKTDSSAGQIYQAEGGLGVKLPGGFKLEGGALWQYWFIPSQGNRRLHVAGTEGAVISWNRQETRASGGYFRLDKSFGKGAE